jgi:hypothetical protein
MYYKCVKFHKNPISRLGGVALTRYMDGGTDGHRCCLKFRRGDNSTYTFTKMGGMYLVRATPTKLLKTDGWTDRVIPIYPPNFACGGYTKSKNIRGNNSGN